MTKDEALMYCCRYGTPTDGEVMLRRLIGACRMLCRLGWPEEPTRQWFRWLYSATPDLTFAGMIPPVRRELVRLAHGLVRRYPQLRDAYNARLNPSAFPIISTDLAVRQVQDLLRELGIE